MSEFAKPGDRVFVFSAARWVDEGGLQRECSKSVRGRYGTVVEFRGAGLEDSVVVRPDDHPEGSVVAGWYVGNSPLNMRIADEDERDLEEPEYLSPGIKLTTRLVVEVYAGDSLVGRLPYPGDEEG